MKNRKIRKNIYIYERYIKIIKFKKSKKKYKNTKKSQKNISKFFLYNILVIFSMVYLVNVFSQNVYIIKSNMSIPAGKRLDQLSSTPTSMLIPEGKKLLYNNMSIPLGRRLCQNQMFHYCDLNLYNLLYKNVSVKNVENFSENIITYRNIRKDYTPDISLNLLNEIANDILSFSFDRLSYVKKEKNIFSYIFLQSLPLEIVNRSSIFYNTEPVYINTSRSKELRNTYELMYYMSSSSFSTSSVNILSDNNYVKLSYECLIVEKTSHFSTSYTNLDLLHNMKTLNKQIHILCGNLNAINIVTWNKNKKSAVNAIERIKSIINETKADVLLINEANLNKNHEEVLIKINGFNVEYDKMYNNKNNARSIMYIK